MSNANEPAYPFVQPDPHGGYPYISNGLTKREAFALAAMQGMRAAMSPGHASHADVARAAVNQADELLRELDKQP